MHISPPPKHRAGATSEAPPPVDFSPAEMHLWRCRAWEAFRIGAINGDHYALILALSGGMALGLPYFPSLANIAEMVGRSRTTVRKWLGRLQKVGLLIIIPRKVLVPWLGSRRGGMQGVQTTNAYLPRLPEPDEVFEPRRRNCEAVQRPGLKGSSIKKKEEGNQPVDNSRSQQLSLEWAGSLAPWERRAALDARTASVEARLAAEYARRRVF